MEIRGERIGEVVATATASFTTQCYRLHQAPPLGTLVCAGQPLVYGVVVSVTSGPLDPGRVVVARGADAHDEEVLFQENPHWERLLTTHFESRVVGYQEGDALRPGLPPLPPRLHAFVYSVRPAVVQTFLQDLSFLHLLLAPGTVEADEALAAFLRASAAISPEGREAFLRRAGYALAIELSRDAPRLHAILRRLAL
ncbi:MAG: hypothetical protein NZ951_07455 [Dehalococcoidia bacterium]|nr:hypothetical protein [Dehalococcoidia bacterium]MDW8119286.1 hypothetical protein [Chloroflexota bacterium]